MPDTYVALCIDDIRYWFKHRTMIEADLSEWWIVKSSRGNGGKDVWILHNGNWKEVLDGIIGPGEYVLQK